MAKIDGVQRATGRSREEWFELLDAWGAADRQYRESAAWLRDEHDLSRWWAQKIVVEYEQARGVRAPGVRPDGTFEVSASKTIAVPLATAFDAFADETQRKRWLTDGDMSLRGSDRKRSASFDWGSGSSRVKVDLYDKGPSRTLVSVMHSRLLDGDEAQKIKAQWRDRLKSLRSFLES